MSIVNDDGHEHSIGVQHVSLLQFHRRFGHLCYDTINNIARDTLPLVTEGLIISVFTARLAQKASRIRTYSHERTV